MNKCVAIGVFGLCDTYSHYLDSYGISLKKSAKIADSSFLTGKKLVDEMVDMAWHNVFNDLQISGFKLKGVNESITDYFSNKTTSIKDFSFSFSTCKYENIRIKFLKIKVVGSLDVTITLNDETITGTFTDETIIVENKTYKDLLISISVNGTGSLQYANDYPFEINLEKYCDETLFYCQYSDWLIEAVKIKSTALILNNTLFSDRYNDFILYKKEDIKLRISQLDSSLNVFTDNTVFAKKGLYQIEIENINRKLSDIVKNSKCNDCCFECNTIYQTKYSKL